MEKAVKSRGHVILQVAVVLFACVLLWWKWMSVGENAAGSGLGTLEAQGTARNERSTPRSFILPATPGIAFEQERQNSERAQVALLAECVRSLKDLGYQLSSSDGYGSVKVVEAIYEFQVKHNLPATGQLDEATKMAMKCS